jgi:hypothetical protein
MTLVDFCIYHTELFQAFGPQILKTKSIWAAICLLEFLAKPNDK